MSQQASPISDVSVSGWSPTPVTPEVNESVPKDSTYVSSSANPQGDTFEVKLAALAWPEAGPETLTVRVQQVGSGSDSVTMTLLQGDGTIIASRLAQAPSSFANAFDPPLSTAEINRITDYTDLHVRVTAGLIQTSCCPNGLPPLLYAHLSNATGGCGCLNGLTVPLVWDGQQLWSNTFPFCGETAPGSLISLQCSSGLFALSFDGCVSRHPPAPKPADNCNPFSITWTGLICDFCCSGTVDVTVNTSAN
jgi:hypothetical protein